ncbi:bifunctional epoxide hydrolase 2-like protein [Trifolium pratense]|uniref:Bifunctional epoxide hydrolase 2-like protein n=1 Tax=Trifolium pratense TaxID=57577 RepID=A0A2K3MSM1_TRIPR|nr:bifunctional epoxide hydrolase 2-like protein [Trifolium pratense]
MPPAHGCRTVGDDLKLPDTVVKVPTLLIMGGKDYVFKFPGFEDLIKSEKAKEFVPNLEVTFIPEGTHFVQEQFPEQVNQLILAFLAKNT